MDGTILAPIRVKTLVKSEGIGCNEEADGQACRGVTCTVFTSTSVMGRGAEPTQSCALNCNVIYYATSFLQHTAACFSSPLMEAPAEFAMLFLVLIVGRERAESKAAKR